MPDKPSLIIVHGMGEHTEQSFKKEIVDSLNYALGLYDKWQGKKIDELVDIIPFEYNSYFDKHRKLLADASQPLASRLEQLQLAGIKVVVGEIAKWESELNKDNFFKTHWLDVLFYRYTDLAEPIRLKLAETIVKAIRNRGAQNVHVLGHSLGTSVVHDTLASLYSPSVPVDLGRNLSPSSEKLPSVHLVANVSHLLESFVGTGASVVNPCKKGCVRTYYQYRHVLDPFMLPSPFEPVENGIWCEEIELSKMRYQELRPRLLTDLNTHAITHYLENPVSHVPLMQVLNFGFAPSETQISKAFKLHKEAKSIQGRAEDIKNKWEAINLKNLNSVEAFIKSGQALRDMLAEYGKTFG